MSTPRLPSVRSLLVILIIAQLCACGGAAERPRPVIANGATVIAGGPSVAAEEPLKVTPPPQDIVPITEGVTPPKIVTLTPVVYPRAASEICAEGWSIARCVITKNGDAAGCRVVRSVPKSDRSILQALSQWRFAPAIFNGEAVNVEYDLKMWVGPPGAARPVQNLIGGAPGTMESPAGETTEGPKTSGSDGEAPGAAGVPLAPPTAARPAGEVVLPFGAGMTRPRMLCGASPRYTKEAIALQVEGLAIIKCVITSSGRVVQCRTIKSLPYMDAELIKTLQSQRYTPAMFQSRPVAVEYIFNIRLKI